MLSFSKRDCLSYVLAATFAGPALLLTSCAPVDNTPRPALSEVRSGSARGAFVEDTRLRSDEVAGEVVEIDRSRRELRVVTEDGRRRSLGYDVNTRVMYHGFQYRTEDLEAGDRIAFRADRGDRTVDEIRLQEPVQARAARGSEQRSAALPPRPDVIEGTVERIDYPRGIFDVRSRNGRTVTVSIPYNARPGDVDNFRSLRRGDRVRVEGEFVNPESFQLMSFSSSR